MKNGDIKQREKCVEAPDDDESSRFLPHFLLSLSSSIAAHRSTQLMGLEHAISYTCL